MMGAILLLPTVRQQMPRRTSASITIDLETISDRCAWSALRRLCGAACRKRGCRALSVANQSGNSIFQNHARRQRSFVRGAVYPLRVVIELPTLREMSEQTRQWFTREDAAEIVEEGELAQIIREFAPVMSEA
jgi:hypothetical protein